MNHWDVQSDLQRELISWCEENIGKIKDHRYRITTGDEWSVQYRDRYGADNWIENYFLVRISNKEKEILFTLKFGGIDYILINRRDPNDVDDW